MALPVGRLSPYARYIILLCCACVATAQFPPGSDPNVDGGWGDWTDWAECSELCGTNGTHHKSRECNNPVPTGEGLPCDGISDDVKDCLDLPPCPVDGGWSEWASWSPCTQTCGIGSQSTYRTCDNPVPVGSGVNCDGDPLKTKDCTGLPCDVQGGWGPWSDYSECSVTCGEGQKVRDRLCDSPVPIGFGMECEGDPEEFMPCPYFMDIISCDRNGGWSDWTDFTPCSHTCGDGVSSRTRMCDNPEPTGTGSLCQTNEGGLDMMETNTQPCNLVDCADDSGECTSNPCMNGATCGYSFNSYTCDCVSGYTGIHCESDIDIDECTSNPCVNGATCNADVNSYTCVCVPGSTGTHCENGDGGWSEWNDFTSCSKTCDVGVRSRQRMCASPQPTGSGRQCQTNAGGFDMLETHTQPCEVVECSEFPVDGGWSAWSEYGSCPVTCGTGEVLRMRACNNPTPQMGGAVCVGDIEDLLDCGLAECSSPGDDTDDVTGVVGEWSEWSEMSACSATCNVGESERTRVCEGGTNCDGDAVERHMCMIVDCADVPIPMSGLNITGGVSMSSTYKLHLHLYRTFVPQLANTSSLTYWDLFHDIQYRLQHTIKISSTVVIHGISSIVFSAGSVQVEMTVVTEGSHPVAAIRQFIVNETQGGSLSDFVDPSSIIVEHWTGPVYQIIPDGCLSNPCLNGGTCLHYDSRYQCRCTAGLVYGVHCEFVFNDYAMLPGPDKIVPSNEGMRATFIVISLFLAVILIVLIVVVAVKVRVYMRSRRSATLSSA